MATDRWQLISQIYHDARSQPADAREAFIREACEGDEQLKREVSSLLAEPSSDNLLDGLLDDEVAAGLNGEASSMIRKLGRFEVRDLLGAGGMGVVYRAHDASLGRDVAIKILPAAFTRDPGRLARFDRDARLLAALSHPHIAAIYGVEALGDESGADIVRRALVLELVDGETLAERLQRSRLSIAEAIEIARQIAAGVEAAHEKGVVHRDLKPANIRIGSDGVVKILDFGLAKAEGPAIGSGAGAPAGGAETIGGAILGTPAYMSPEQARGAAVDKAP